MGSLGGVECMIVLMISAGILALVVGFGWLIRSRQAASEPPKGSED